MTAITRLPFGATAEMAGGAVTVAHEDLEIVAQVVALHLMPGSGEADRLAHVKRLLEVSADLSYASSTYAHRVLGFSRRRPCEGDVLDETVALQDALEAFGRQVRLMADAYLTVRAVRADTTVEPKAS